MVTVDDASGATASDSNPDVGMTRGMGEEDVSLEYTHGWVYRIAE